MLVYFANPFVYCSRSFYSTTTGAVDYFFVPQQNFLRVLLLYPSRMANTLHTISILQQQWIAFYFSPILVFSDPRCSMCRHSQTITRQLVENTCQSVECEPTTCFLIGQQRVVSSRAACWESQIFYLYNNPAVFTSLSCFDPHVIFPYSLFLSICRLTFCN